MLQTMNAIKTSQKMSRCIYGMLNILDTQRVNYNLTATRSLKQKLPKLPVPPLQETLTKYFKSVKPLLSDEELKKTDESVQRFGAENGCKLQEYLMLKAECSENWLADWWLNAAYLDFRSPVVVWSSPGLVFPFECFREESDRIAYTTKLIMAALDYKKQIDEDQIPVDMMGKDPLDMNQYKKVFGTCRIPGLKRDCLEFHPDSKHIVVAYSNQFFKLPVINCDGCMISYKQLACELKKIVTARTKDVPPIGILTTEHRDAWGKAYAELIKHADNVDAFNDIQTSLFLVCLDDEMPPYECLNRQTVASHQLIHGGGSDYNSGNRWYDKTIQFVIGKTGIVGLTYEHSPSEGQPIAVMTDYLVNYIKSGKYEGTPDAKNLQQVDRVLFTVDPKVCEYIEKAQENIDKLVNDLELSSFTFKSFGKDFIKRQKLSPDSFIQMAIQYAFYRLHLVPGAHYESAATRKYLHGRTETIRSCSEESIAFAKAMLDDKVSDVDKVNALTKAINGHKKYSLDAVNGYGVDRHLLGLKLMAMEKQLEPPSLYKDKSYAKSTHMRVSTSQVATKCDGFMCYGPLVMDGYACCYNPRDNDMNFGIAAMRSNAETSAVKFHEALEESLMDMHNVLLKIQKHKL